MGRGTWSVVYRATAQRTGHPIALKMLLRGLPCGDAHAEQRFFREAQITAALQHPNTLRVFDVGRTSGGALYIASERLQGPTLEDELADRAARYRVMEETEVLEIADAVLRSLAEAHDRGMVHRDLKPANIVLHTVAGERVVKVLDFGIASLQGDRITPRGVSLGTPDYMSPEQCARQDVDGRSDLYALGVILYRAISGHVPFTGNDVFEVMQHHRQTDAPDVRDVSPAVSDGLALLIDRALAKHPGERFHDARAMREAVVRAARDLPVQPRLRAQSSAHIPRVIVSQAPTKDTGSWRVSAQDPVTAATQRDTEQTGRVRSTAKYTQVTSEDLEAHRMRAPELRLPGDTARPPPADGKHPSLAHTVVHEAVPLSVAVSRSGSSRSPSTTAPAAKTATAAFRPTSRRATGSSGVWVAPTIRPTPVAPTVPPRRPSSAIITVSAPSPALTKPTTPPPQLAGNKAPIWPWAALVAGAVLLVWVLIQ